MADIAKLLAKLPNWDPARDALEALAKLPLADKRAKVYPHVVDLAVKWWCVEEGASNCGYEVENVAKFIVSQLGVEPDLASAVYEGIGKRKVKFREHYLYNFARRARDPRALKLLRGMWKAHVYTWGDTILALDGTGLADDALAALQANPSSGDLATAVGALGGESMIDPLLKLAKKSGSRLDGYGLGLILAGCNDEGWFKSLSTSGEGATAKRLFAALHKPKQKDRLAAIDAISKGTESQRTCLSPGGLIGLCRLLGDADALIGQRVAPALAAYAKARSEYQDDVYFIHFLAAAKAAITRGVTPAVREALDAVQATIPHSAPFASGPVAAVAKPEIDTRAAATEQRAREKLAAMGVAPGAPQAPNAKPAKAGKKSAEKPAQKPFGAALGALATAPSKLRDALPTKAGSHRNPALDAQIEADPTERAHYLVYGDWLQQQGDSRGALIALHDAADRGEKGAADAAALLVREHRYTLLGLLDGVTEIELEWQLGFIRHARLSYDSQKALLAGLATLLDADSARFLQSIAIDPVDRKPPDGDAIVKLLIERSPRTLAHLQIGKPGTWTIPDELRAALPRLARDPNLVWNEVLAKIAEQKRLEIRFLDPKKLPELVPRTGKPAADPDQILLGLRAELEKAKPIGIVAALPRTFTPESIDAFALALARQWTENDGQAIVKFAFDALGPLGGDACAKFLGANLTTWSHVRALQAVEHLKRIGSDPALYQIIRLVLLPGAQPRRDAAETVLEGIAKTRDGSLDDLFDQIAPDNDLVGQRAWLTRLLVHGHRIKPDAFAAIAKDKIRGPLAATLVWATFTGKKDLAETFTVARNHERPNNGSLRHADGSVFELGDARVGLVHPIELSRELLDTWRETLQHRDLEQVILQLDRPTFRMSAADADTESLDWFKKRRAGFTLIQTTLAERDWVVHEQYDAGGTESFARLFERSNIRVVASFGSGMGSIATVRLESAGRYERRRFSNVDAVTVSELLYDLEVAHGYREASRSAANRAPTPTPSRGGGNAPSVERAKTGRSKCVVCEQPIAKGDPRVGVERQIQTDTFTGRGNVWSHPACREGIPELAGVDVDALVATL